MSYARAKLKMDEEEYAFKVYLTDAVQAVTENTVHPGGKFMGRRWAEIIAPPTPERSATAVAADIMRGAGLKFKK